MTPASFRSRTLVAFCVAGLMGGGWAMAQSGPAPVAQADALQAQDQAATEQPVANQGGTVDKKRPIDRKCLQYTGSRISASDASKGKRRCISGPGSAYSKDDLDSTGQVDVGRALRNLDPSIKSN